MIGTRYSGCGMRSLSLLRYPGGKSRLAKQISSRILAMSEMRRFVYCEPFLGGGSVALSLASELNDTSGFVLNDRDVGIAALWNAAISQTEELVSLIMDFVPSADAFYALKSAQGGGDIHSGFRKLALHAMSYSGLGELAGGPIGGRSQASEWDAGCRWNAPEISRKIRRISHLVRTRVSCAAATDVLRGLGNESIAYIDPPYYHRGSKLYKVSMDSSEHAELAEFLLKSQFRWLLSYDDCEEIRDLYSWAKTEEIGVTYTICSARRDGASKSGRRTTELLICRD